MLKKLVIRCFCVYAGVFLIAPLFAIAANAVAADAAVVENEVILRELMVLREEIAALREETRVLADRVLGKGGTASDSPSDFLRKKLRVEDNTTL